MRRAYSSAGPAAVQGFRTVLEQIIDPDMRNRIERLLENGE